MTEFTDALRNHMRLEAQRALAHKTFARVGIVTNYDPAHYAIVVSRIFDDPRVPGYAVEYIVYHEMLHLRHPVKLRGSRRCVHPTEFQADEKLFPELQKAQQFLKRL